MIRVDPVTAAVSDPPVALAKSWVANRTFPPERPLIDCSQAVPSHPPAEALRAHLAEVVTRTDTGAYAPALGLAHVRAAAAAHLTRAYQGTVQDQQVMITAGCNQAFCLATGVLAGPGDEVVLPTPYYFNHDMWLRAQGVTPLYVEATPPSMVPDLTAIADAVGPRTRAVVLVTPNNPTGALYPPEMIAACFDLCAQRGIALVLDETYKDFRATSGPAHGLFARSDWPDTLVQLFSFSKVFSLAGYRAGSLVAHPDVLRQAVKLADCQTICAPRIAQEAVAFGLEHLDDWVADNRAEMTRRVEAVQAAFAASPGGYGLVSAGAYFAWVSHPGPEPALERARRLAEDAHVLTIPGECFGPGLEGYIRLAFGNVAPDDLTTLAQRLTNP